MAYLFCTSFLQRRLLLRLLVNISNDWNLIPTTLRLLMQGNQCRKDIRVLGSQRKVELIVRRHVDLRFLRNESTLPRSDWLSLLEKLFRREKVELFPTFLRIRCEINIQDCACLDTFASDFAANSLRNSPRDRKVISGR